MKQRVSQLIVRLSGIIGVGLTASQAEILAASIIAVVTVVIDLTLHRFQHGNVLGGGSVTDDKAPPG